MRELFLKVWARHFFFFYKFNSYSGCILSEKSIINLDQWSILWSCSFRRCQNQIQLQRLYIRWVKLFFIYFILSGVGGPLSGQTCSWRGAGLLFYFCLWGGFCWDRVRSGLSRYGIKDRGFRGDRGVAEESCGVYIVQIIALLLCL